MSVRALNAELGLSHETIGQRFGSKQRLFLAAVGLGVSEFNLTFAAARSAWPADLDDLDELRATIRSFVTAASEHPEIGRLINQEGGEEGDRLDHLLRMVLRPSIDALAALVARLIEHGEIRSVTAREIFFLSQAGAAPFNLPRLSAAFDDIDGPLDRDAHIESVTGTIVEGIRSR